MELSDASFLETIKQGESVAVEFKESHTALDGVKKTVCAFANNLAQVPADAFVFIGVKDDGSIIGATVTDEDLKQLANIRNGGDMVPPPQISIKTIQIESKAVVVIQVGQASSPPVRLKGVVWVRIGTTTVSATPDDERRLLEQRSARNMPFDAIGIEGATGSDLDFLQFQQEYLPQAISPEIIAENGRSVEQQLASLKLTDPKGTPTPTGLLTIGRNPGEWLPGAYVQFRRVAGTEIYDDTSDQAELRGTLSQVIRDTEARLRVHNSASLIINEGKHEQRTSYPMQALEQLLRNAIMHRDYSMTAPVRVTWFDDRIQIDNPGGPFGMSPADFGKPGFTGYRNPNVAEAMKTLGFAERFGAGIQIARALLERNGHPDLELKTEGNFVFCVIWGRA
jgi:ATP-dependent DNA helicase RecG